MTPCGYRNFQSPINNKLTAYSGLHEVEHAHSFTAFRYHH